MRLRCDHGGEIGVFEDLQTLLVVVAGIAILLVSILFNWSAFDEAEEDQDMYDAAEHIIKQIEAWDLLRAVNSYGAQYHEFHLRQPELAILVREGGFEEHIGSDLQYNVTFHDLAQEEYENFTHKVINENYTYEWFPEYEFGDPVPEDVETVVAQVQYAMVMEIFLGPQDYDVSERHPVLVQVVVWR